MTTEVKSIIKTVEMVDNKARKFGSINHYLPCYIENDDGTMLPALFTENDILQAKNRARQNPEDVGDQVPMSPTLYYKLFG